MTVPNVVLNNGIEIPQVGFGVWRVPSPETKQAVATALAAGYGTSTPPSCTTTRRASAPPCASPASTGTRCSSPARSGTPTRATTPRCGPSTRPWNGSASTCSTCTSSTGRGRRPAPRRTPGERWRSCTSTGGSVRSGCPTSGPTTSPGSRHRRGRADGQPGRAAPLPQQRETRAANDAAGIATEAWSPIAKGGDLLRDPVVTGLAEKHDRGPAQVVLRWHLQLSTIVIPKSVRPSRIEENLDVFGFELDADDMAAMAGLDREGRVGPHPDQVS